MFPSGSIAAAPEKPGAGVGESDVPSEPGTSRASAVETALPPPCICGVATPISVTVSLIVRLPPSGKTASGVRPRAP